MQQYIPFVFEMHIYPCQQCDNESVAMEMEQCILFIVALHTSLPTQQYETHSGLQKKMAKSFNKIRIFLKDFHKCSQYRISGKSVQWALC
jgi:hypothetical protein